MGEDRFYERLFAVTGCMVGLLCGALFIGQNCRKKKITVVLREEVKVVDEKVNETRIVSEIEVVLEMEQEDEENSWVEPKQVDIDDESDLEPPDQILTPTYTYLDTTCEQSQIIKKKKQKFDFDKKLPRDSIYTKEFQSNKKKW